MTDRIVQERMPLWWFWAAPIGWLPVWRALIYVGMVGSDAQDVHVAGAILLTMLAANVTL